MLDEITKNLPIFYIKPYTLNCACCVWLSKWSLSLKKRLKTLEDRVWNKF